MWVLLGALLGCGRPPSPPDDEIGGPRPIPKEYTDKKVYVHMMPWFQTPKDLGVKDYQPPVDPSDPTITGKGSPYEATKAAGVDRWGMHWTMANRDPTKIVDGRREIASYYHPATGPYASGDRYVIEYQLLLMKYAGIDGVILDDPGQTWVWDMPTNEDNVEAIVSMTSEVGLDFAIAYEDRVMDEGLARMPGFDPEAQAPADMAWYRDHYFGRSNYVHIGGKPLVACFGPIHFKTPEEWERVLAPLGGDHTFLALYWQSSEAGADGEFSWIDSAAGLEHWYRDRDHAKVGMGSAFPGFAPFYDDGGWGSDIRSTPIPVSTDTFERTLEQAKASDVGQIQLVTWNDYGEGSMIEPTVEFGFAFLTTLQRELGVDEGEADLALVARLWAAHQAAGGDAVRQSQLETAFHALAARDTARAACIIDGCAGG